MEKLLSGFKQIVLGKPLSSDLESQVLLPKYIALPVFASDALSSVAYAPDEIILTLSFAGVSFASNSVWVGLAVAAVMLVVVASYRQNVHAYPSGGGDFEVVSSNLSNKFGIGVAAALIVDYILTVSVSIASGAQYFMSIIPPQIGGHKMLLCATILLLLVIINLRGVKESGAFFAIPVYLFILLIGIIIIFGLFEYFTGSLGKAPTAHLGVVANAEYKDGIFGFAAIFLIARAFASGCTALTGVEAISNGVPAFRKPKSTNAATTLLILGCISTVMLISILFLSNVTGVKYVNNPAEDLTINGIPMPDNYFQIPAIGQLAFALTNSFSPLFFVASITTGLILILAANTAFNGFPVLSSVLAKSKYFPHQFYTRGGRLAYSNGIISLAVISLALIFISGADTSKLIQLYIVGVFISFTFSQLSMIIHWNKNLKICYDSKKRIRMKKSRIINCIGFLLTLLVLVIVIITKFTHGAYISLLLMAFFYVLMNKVYKHYKQVAKQLKVRINNKKIKTVTGKTRAIILISNITRPAIKTLSYAKFSNPDSIEALTVSVDSQDTTKLETEYLKQDLGIPLKILDSPYRQITRPVIHYIKNLRQKNPNDIIIVYIPEFVVSKWWQQFLHNQSALRIKTQLHYMNGVIVSSVPWRPDEAIG
ncbi:MAG: APC family permease [Bifidobacteriaceae bacterium]|nr:APC family permease [Bifidobacteriaceae bacterium]